MFATQAKKKHLFPQLIISAGNSFHWWLFITDGWREDRVSARFEHFHSDSPTPNEGNKQNTMDIVTLGCCEIWLAQG